MENWKKINDIPIFHIIGTWRSGTTLLSTMLNEHPEIISTHESTFAVAAMHRFGKTTTWTEEQVTVFYEWLWRDRNLNFIWNIDRKVLKQQLYTYASHHPNPTLGGLCKLVYAAYQSQENTKTPKALVDKNPIYTLLTAELDALYCTSANRYICLVRDYRDNIVSRMRYRFHQLPLTSVYAEWWRVMNQHIVALHREHPERFLLIRYEDLAEFPDRTTDKIMHFIGLTSDPSMLEFRTTTEKNKNAYLENLQASFQNNTDAFIEERKAMGGNLLKTINTSSIGGWKTQLTARQQQIAALSCDQTATLLHFSKEVKRVKRVDLLLVRFLARQYVGISKRLFLRKIRRGKR
jgi:hypothetical protein